MEVFREPIFHDIQCVTDDIPQSTNSNVFVDVVDATLTTKDLGSEGTYKIWFSILISGSLNNTVAAFKMYVDGIPIDAMDRPISLRVKDLDIGYTFLGCAEDIPALSVFQIKWKTDQGTITLAEHNLLIEGIPQGRVIE